MDRRGQPQPVLQSKASAVLLFVGEMASPSPRRRAAHDQTATLTGRFASRQHRSLARPVKAAAVFDAPMAKLCVLHTGCRVPLVVKEPRTARSQGGHIMNADELKKLTTDSLDRLAALLDEGQSDAARRAAEGDGPLPSLQLPQRLPDRQPATRRPRASRGSMPGARSIGSSARARRASRSWRRSSRDEPRAIQATIRSASRASAPPTSLTSRRPTASRCQPLHRLPAILELAQQICVRRSRVTASF